MTILSGLLSLYAVAAPVPTVSEQTMGDIYLVEGSFEVAAPRDVAWDVLTDYGTFPSFVSDVRTSVVTNRQPGKVLVAQEATGRAAIFVTTVRLTLEMVEELGQQIVFRDVLRKDFELFEGTWTLGDSPTGIRVSYRLRTKPRSGAPRFIVGPAVEASTGRLLTQMQVEIEKRARVALSES